MALEWLHVGRVSPSFPPGELTTEDNYDALTGGDQPGPGTNLRVDPQSLGSYWVDRDGVCDEFSPTCPRQLHYRTSYNPARRGPFGEAYQHPTEGRQIPAHVDYPLEARVRSSGVQTGGLLTRDMARRVFPFGAPDPDDAYAVRVPASATGDDWHPEAMFASAKTCGRLGGDAIYCVAGNGTAAGTITGVANVAAGHWWVMPREPESVAGECLTRASVFAQQCADGVAWLLDATATRPSIDHFDPTAMQLTEYPLADHLPGFPTSLTRVQLAAAYLPVTYEQRTSDYTKILLLVSAWDDADDPTRWVLRLDGAGAPSLLYGPFDVDLEGHYGPGIPYAPLRVIPNISDEFGALQDPLVIVLHPLYGDVSTEVLSGLGE